MSQNPTPSPFTPEQQVELNAATTRAKKIRRACAIARFDAWTTAVFAAFSLAFSLFDLTSLIVGLALAGVATNAFAGEKLLRNFDLRGPRRLGINQLIFMGVVFAYCTWQIIATITRNGGAAQLQSIPTMADLTQWVQMITLLVYGAVMISSFLTQGATAWYYFSRTRYVRAYLDETPEWVLHVQRSVG